MGIPSHLRQPCWTFRRTFAEKVTQNRLSLSYEEFLRAGADGRLLEDIRRQAFYEIQKDAPEVELILVGFINEEPVLFRYDGRTVCREDQFVAIGSGATIAESNLYQREHHEHSNLARTIYVVWESHCLAEIAPGVGPNKTIVVVSSKEMRFVSDIGEKYLAEHYSRLGPQKLDLKRFPKSGFD